MEENFSLWTCVIRLTTATIALSILFLCVLQSEPFGLIDGGQIYVKDNTLCLYAQVTET